jgi:hypothetical protein
MSLSTVLVVVVIAVFIRLAFFRRGPKTLDGSWTGTSDSGSSTGFDSGADGGCDGGGDGGGGD